MHTLASARLGRLAGVCGVLLCTPTCTEHPVEAVVHGSCEGPPSTSYAIALVTNLEVDVLFVIDDSGSMAEEQATLANNFGHFMQVIDSPGFETSYRVGITTTDDGSPGCSQTTAEAGALQLRSCRSRPEDFTSDGFEGPVLDTMEESCHAVCPEQWAEIETLPTTTWHDDVPRSRPWIESSAGVTNLPPGLSPAQALQCLGPQGIGGCAFESPLEAMWKAVERTRTPGDPNFGFIRDHAVLLVVFVTDEVDCSFNPEWTSALSASGDRVFWSDPELEAPTSAVCWNAGVACDGADPRHCHSVDLDIDAVAVGPDDAEELAVLRPVSRYIEQLQELEDRKQLLLPDREVLVALVGGVNVDGTVTYADVVTEPMFQHDFGIGPGCASSSGRAAPPVRLRELTEAFQVHEDHAMHSICQPDYSAALRAIARPLIDSFRPACMPACVADMDRSTPEILDPSCVLVQDVPDHFEGHEGYVDQTVPRCDDDGGLPSGAAVCYVTLVGHERNEYCIDQGFNAEFRLIRREGVYVPGGTVVRASCVLSACDAIDCPDLPRP